MVACSEMTNMLVVQLSWKLLTAGDETHDYHHHRDRIHKTEPEVPTVRT
jgi:hypothetical protein